MLDDLFSKIVKKTRAYKHLSLVRDIMDDERLSMQRTIDGLKKEIESLHNPEKVLKQIIEGGVPWYDYSELDKALLEEYKRHAEMLLKNPVFINEINFLIQNYAKQALDTVMDFDDLIKIRHEALGMKMLEERVKSIPKVENKQVEVEDPYSAI